jgi:cytochrome c-type biogenesis protein CcmE
MRIASFGDLMLNGVFWDRSAHSNRLYVQMPIASLTGGARAPTLIEAMKISPQTLRIGAAAVIILGTITYLAITGVQADKSYYVTISELQAMGNKAYTRHLRVAGDVAAHSIERSGTNAKFVLSEQGHTLQVSYQGIEPPPDTFKDGSQALAMGTYGRDGVFHATELQAKCASKYAAAKPAPNTASLKAPTPAVPAK